MSTVAEVLQEKKINEIYSIVLLKWERNTFTEYSTHVKNDRGYDAGKYFDSFESAEKDFYKRIKR